VKSHFPDRTNSPCFLAIIFTFLGEECSPANQGKAIVKPNYLKSKRFFADFYDYDFLFRI
jgi:hypothetical protein